MNTHWNTRRGTRRSWLASISPVAAAAAALTICLTAAGHAEPLILSNVPAARAAAQLGARFGVDIRLQGNTSRLVTLTVEDPDAADARLRAVNELANAAGLTFTKHYVVTRAGGSRALPPAADSSAVLPADGGTLPAREAISLVAGMDDATAQVAADVTGTVTLPDSRLGVGAAAAEIARQTGTSWRTIYVLSSPGRGPAGAVVGRAGGQPIMELAYVYYVDPQKEAARQRAAEAAQRQADQEEQSQAAATQRALGQQAAAYQQAMAQRGGQAVSGSYYMGTSPYGSGGTPAYGGYGAAYPNNSFASPYAAGSVSGSGYGGVTLSPAYGPVTFSGTNF